MGKRKLSHVKDTESDEKEGSLKAPEGGGSDEETAMEVKVVGEMLRKSGKGKSERRHYQAFEVDDCRYDIDDPVLVTPEKNGQKPYVAIIKEIKQTRDGSIQVTGQWFYRPEEAEKKGGGTWVSTDSRELFYSFHIDEVPAESVMHKCQVYFIPPQKQLPLRSKHPGFIVRRVYDACEKKLFNLTDKDYEDPMQKEIDLLVQKTRDALGDLPDVEGEETVPTGEDEYADPKAKRQRSVRRMTPLNVNREDALAIEIGGKVETPPGKSETVGRGDTPTSCGGPDLEVSSLLRTHNVHFGVHARDRWLEKLVHTVRDLCGGGKGFRVRNGGEDTSNKDNMSGLTELDAGAASKPQDGGETEASKQGSAEESVLGEGFLAWREIADVAVEVISALETLSYDSLGNDLHKYNIKMRQLDFNLKSSKVLARRLLNKELEPLTVLNMTPAELKDGFTTVEKVAQEPPEEEAIQMADVRCSICTERQVGVKDIIHVGYGDRYQLECLKCGHSWYASRDTISSLVDAQPSPTTVGAAPWATSKFEEVEKDLTSPHEGMVSSSADSSIAVPAPPPHTTSHYQEVQNLLTEKIPVTNHPHDGTGTVTTDQSIGNSNPQEDSHLSGGIPEANPPLSTGVRQSSDGDMSPSSTHVENSQGSILGKIETVPNGGEDHIISKVDGDKEMTQSSAELVPPGS